MINNLNKFRNNLNKIAEIGWNEFKTTDYIKKNIPLTPIVTSFNKTNVGLLYKIGKGEKAILIRADIDALKTSKGVEHTCGHSTHTSALMGALINSKELSNQLSKKNKAIYFLFQPAEETYPSGAKAFVNENPNLIKNINFAFAGHVRPLASSGSINIISGPVMAEGDYFEMEFLGKTVHVKNAHLGNDAIAAASEMVLFSKFILNKYKNKLRIGIGVFSGGLQPNTIANYCLLKGDLRFFDKKIKEKLKKIVFEKIKKIEEKYNVNIKLHYSVSSPILSNNKKLAKNIYSFLKQNNLKIISDEKAVSYGTEDFAFISEKIPSLYVLIGTGDKADIHAEDCVISEDGLIAFYEYFKAIIKWWITS